MNKTPDVILVENDKSGWFPAEWDTGPDFVDQNDVTKYIRADLYTDLLKQARDALATCRNTAPPFQCDFIFDESLVYGALTAIDKALDESK